MAKKGNRVQVILECTEQKTTDVPGTSRYMNAGICFDHIPVRNGAHINNMASEHRNGPVKHTELNGAWAFQVHLLFQVFFKPIHFYNF